MNVTRILGATDINYKIICAGSGFDIGAGKSVIVEYEGKIYNAKMHSKTKGRIDGLAALFADAGFVEGQEIRLSYDAFSNLITITATTNQNYYNIADISANSNSFEVQRSYVERIDVWSYIPRTDDEKFNYIKEVIKSDENAEVIWIRGKLMLFATDNSFFNKSKSVFLVKLDDSFGWTDDLWEKRITCKDKNISVKSAITLGAMFPIMFIDNLYGKEEVCWLSEEVDSKVFMGVQGKYNFETIILDLNNRETWRGEINDTYYRIVDVNGKRRILISSEHNSYLFDYLGNVITVIKNYVCQGIIGVRYVALTNDDNNDMILDMITGKTTSEEELYRGVAFFQKKDNDGDEKAGVMLKGKFGIVDLESGRFTEQYTCVETLKKNNYVQKDLSKYDLNHKRYSN